ncbi:KIR protein [Plasmodium coatneyi]|uniref:KIR protein n=1 Tax=Plasmodium coatneyi TaxID=208452 RepID=A0A1B1DVG4_9APIC|nr:KIR protein [Plasmodium coatneyi]ANQ06773.1 KIR protein [Plasmodium coatneyi]
MLKEYMETLNLGDLPSKSFYNKFDGEEESGYCTTGDVATVKDEIEKILGTHDCDVLYGEDVEKIIHAWCYVAKGTDDDKTSYKDHANFFYLWLGYKLITESGCTKSFKDIMEDIYTKLNSKYGGDKWELNYTNNDNPMFTVKKAVYEYSKDYPTIESQLKPQGTTCDTQYSLYLRGVVPAFNSVRTQCTGGKRSYGAYCDEFDRMFPGDKHDKLKQLKCNPATAVKPATAAKPVASCTGTWNPGSSGSASDDGGSLLRILNSRKAYNKVQANGCFCNNEDDFDKMDKTWWKSSHIEKYKEDIIKAWCNTQEDSIRTAHNSDGCYSLYFWIGDKIWNTTIESNSFSSTMETIYNELTKIKVQHQCNNIYQDSNIMKSHFDQAKTVHDYYKDYTTLLGHLNGNRASCDPEYERHIQKITEACKTVGENCPSGNSNNDPYCTWFQMKNSGGYCNDDKLKELQCNTGALAADTAFQLHGVTFAGQGLGAARNSETKVEQPPSADATPSVNIPAISSVFSVGGIALGAALLYKYTSLPHWISNTFFGNNGGNRKRRTLERNFDTFAEDTSTLYTTDTSTIDGRTEYSAPYTTVRSRRGRNNKRERNIRYQNL